MPSGDGDRTSGLVVVDPMTDTMPAPVKTAPLTLTELATIPVTALTISKRKLEALTNIGIVTVADLLAYYPRRWIDRTRQATISQATVGDDTLILGTVDFAETRPTKNKPMVVAQVSDHTGTIHLAFFNQPWRVQQLTRGAPVALWGKVDMFRDQLQMANPVVDLIGDRTGRLIPVYPQSDREGLSSADFEKWIANALHRCEARGFADPLPERLITKHDLLDRDTALRTIHDPETIGDRNAARKRLAFDELFRLQIVLAARKARIEDDARGIRHSQTGVGLARMRDVLPFPLTGAQARAIGEITADMGKPVPMHRLLQGDVGAGKTVVAVGTMLVALEGGYQAALMAPTEVLAEQHAVGVRKLTDQIRIPDDMMLTGDRPIRVELITNRLTGKKRTAILEALAAGEIDIMVGTHALIEPAVRFDNLGVVVVDEQHRFGVEQRAALRDKRDDHQDPDVLVMTATPIPRTAAMTVYGDLDVSILDELPPGRTPIVTLWANGETELPAAWAQVRDEVAAGRQAYVVCPLVEDSGKMQAAAAEDTMVSLRDGELAGLRIGLLHGKMKADDKEAVMSSFRAGDLDVLVATTVIEVGVDVPNSTVIVILDADRFGIAQLHQLRGRVGRGKHASTCWLATQHCPAGNPRVEALVSTTDGFELAEIDLQLRGEGTILGAAQNGKNDLKLASLQRDRALLAKARDAAFQLISEDRYLEREPLLVAEIAHAFTGDDEWLGKS